MSLLQLRHRVVDAARESAVEIARLPSGLQAAHRLLVSNLRREPSPLLTELLLCLKALHACEALLSLLVSNLRGEPKAALRELLLLLETLQTCEALLGGLPCELTGKPKPLLTKSLLGLLQAELGL